MIVVATIEFIRSTLTGGLLFYFMFNLIGN